MLAISSAYGGWLSRRCGGKPKPPRGKEALPPIRERVVRQGFRRQGRQGGGWGVRQYRRDKAEFIRRDEVPGGAGTAGRGLRRQDEGRRPGRRAGQGPAAGGPALEYRPAPAILVVGVGRIQGDGLVKPPLVGRWEGSVHFMVRLLVGAGCWPVSGRGWLACRWLGGSVDDRDVNGAWVVGFPIALPEEWLPGR